MGILTANLFVTLDGVYQAPGGPEEDRGGGFEFGGWQAAYFDDETGEAIGAGIDRMDALLLGRKTYDIFAGFWPHQEDHIGETFNALPKFVVSQTLTRPEWEGTTALAEVSELSEVKERFLDIHMFGSGHLIRSLLEADLLDRLNLFLYPLTFGSGKRLFADGSGVPAAFRFAQPPWAFPKGAVLLSYERAGAPITGITIGQD
ncbi:dihydrofolate reductase family protein [Paenarthrobacter nitroguajacolicus]|uniref:dihydrofolate reductase family protein n=1 Tax=Paenarthrobacter nitroguajacolicus TaxID=211146 RepID=UPI000A7631D4|nr:dihydrofolate reductase family protein [Paenarthrobacter nitroguajacolicus]